MKLNEGKGRAVTVGVFDGLHLGHQKLLKRLKTEAEREGLEPTVLTFRESVGREKLIQSPERKYRILREMGLETVGVEFEDFRKMEAEDFVKKVLIKKLNMMLFVSGEDFRFGKDREGSVETMKQLGDMFDFKVETVSAVGIDGERVSSSRIRKLIEKGKIKEAGKLLDRPPVYSSETIPGSGRGKKMGFPTVNLRLDERLVIPEEGIYAGMYKLKGKTGKTAVYIGRRPTFGEEKLSMEAYLLGEELEERPERLTVGLVERIRPDKKFSGEEELKKWMEKDVEKVESLVGKEELKDIKEFLG